MEPQLTSFIFSEDSKEKPNANGRGTSLHIINPLNVFKMPFIPNTYSFSVTLGFIKLDPDKNHELEFKLVAPNQAEVFNTGLINIHRDQANPSIPKEANGFTLNLDFRNVEFNFSGEHTGIVILDEHVLSEIPVIVFTKED